MNWFNSVPINLLNSSMDGLWSRKRATLDNIANWETPNYKRKFVTFENELTSQMNKVGLKPSKISENLSSTQASMFTANNETMREDGNNVDIEAENLELARTDIQYDFEAKMLTDYFARLRTVITEGRK